LSSEEKYLNKNYSLDFFKEIDVGFVSNIYAMRLTHTGEDGFMLYIPSEVKKFKMNFIRKTKKLFVLVCIVCV
jgi:glycine cleavage system aminomethyltransferase T